MVSSFLPTSNPQIQFRELLEDLYQGRSLVDFVAGQTIPLHSSDIWVVCRGVVSLSVVQANGEESLLGFAVPSMPFGLPLTMMEMEGYQAIALSHVGLMRFSLAEMEKSPLLCRSLWHQLNRRLRQTEAILALVGHRRVKERLEQLLLLLAQEMGQPTKDGQGIRLPVKLTHQNLANTIGTTRVTVTRLMKELRQDDWLTLDSQRYITIQKF
ncbi:Crp/Fnr family transcriptional regulator [Roseofilum capinflatum]|uniref:Crp/Fnr family transcriptional regulator n=1 Tax=Roseofilum capinflatum BLCC-M114 TaxID=3022440 RepID=A0ABT7BA25_9CYAN|nr:Crp/Fnr family transcriptional regulator [Roseofilum capinflatum]MDJ1175672.1 Crp/Fnr family transcriptional regulator [Roseofilum capinflatum BLCC-M114]